jgi:CheY-like chemotaxis protein
LEKGQANVIADGPRSHGDGRDVGRSGAPPAGDPRAAVKPALDERQAALSRVLVVDDHQDAAMSLAMLIELMGHEVQTASDGVEALEVAEAFRPDVILLDIGMPRMNGYEASRRIRMTEWGSSVRLIALTGWGQDEDRRMAEEAGFDQHLIKPVEADALREALS